MTKRQQFFYGCKSGISVVLGYIPVGIAYAIIARGAGFSVMQTVGMSLTVFAGAAQMMSAGMVAGGAGIVAIIITTFLLNLRHLIMSTCVIHKTEGGGMPLRLLVSFGITDESFAVFATDKKQNSIYSLLGLVLVSYLSWVLSSLLGALAVELLPDMLSAALGIALYALFLALLVPSATANLRLGLLVLLTAGANTLLSLFLDGSLALILSTLGGALAGVFFVELEDGADKASPDQSTEEDTAHE